MKNRLCIAALVAAAGSAQAQWSDDFNRADGALGGSWTITSGTWGILSNQGVHTSAAANDIIQHSAAVAPYSASVSKLDAFCINTTSQFSALVIGLGGTDSIMVKLQAQTATGKFSNIGLYHKTSPTAWAQWTGTTTLPGGGTNTTGFFAIPVGLEFISGRMTVSFPTADVLQLDIDTDFNGTIDQTYTRTGVSTFAANLGTGFGISGWGTAATFDNWEVNGGGAVLGACCITATGACISTTQSACTAQGGVYQGDGSQCGSIVCPQPATGACCFFSSCSVLTQAACTAQNGVYQGNGSACGSCPTVPPVVYSNCNIKTGTTTLSGVGGLPAGAEWSETARDSAGTETGNTVGGFGGTGALRLADDFVVPAGGMNLAYVKVYAYLTGATTPGVTAATLQILNGPPTGTPTVVFGDQTTNRLAAVQFAPIYRCFSTVVPATVGACPAAAATPDQNRHLQEIYITVNQFLPAGTYWIDYNYTGASFSPPATHVNAIGRQCDPNNSNALQFNAGWVALNDTGQGCTVTTVQQDMYFELLGTGGAASCYANCDASTIAPCLNVNDFICFNNTFAAGSSSANCDASTIAPTLNVNDFICFNNKFAAGCANPCANP